MLSSYRSKARRRAAEQLGRQAEDKVAGLFRNKGYELLARRLKTGAGEIDIVVANKQCIVFVEVKARTHFNDAAYALSGRQQKRLWQAATMALACREDWARPEMRFDVALIVSGNATIIENAFWMD